MVDKKDFWKSVGVEEEQKQASTEPIVQTQDPADPSKDAPPVSATSENVFDVNSLSDDQLKELIAKRGISLQPEPQKTAEELEQEKAKKKSEALAWGLKTGRFKPEDYEELTKAQLKKVDLITDEFVNQIKSTNEDLTDEEIQDMVTRYTFSDLEDTDPVKIQRQRELLQLADYKLKNKYSSILNLDKDYTEYERSESEKISLAKKIEAAAPVFQKDIKTILDSFRNGIEYSIEDNVNPENSSVIKISYSDEDLKEVQDIFTNGEAALPYLRDGYEVERLKDQVNLLLMSKHFGRHLTKAAKDYNSLQKEKYLKGRHGILPERNLQMVDPELSTNKVRDDFFAQATAAENK